MVAAMMECEEAPENRPRNAGNAADPFFLAFGGN